MDILKIIDNLQILYVEDNLEVQREVCEILSQFNANIYKASNGCEALEIFKNNHIDLIISDIDMPHMNGIELISSIRQIDKKVAVLMLTAYKTEDYLFECANLNIQAYLLKPISYDKLKEAFKKIIDYLDINKHIIKIIDNIYYDTLNGIVLNNTNEIHLNKKEMRLMSLLLDNKNEIVTYKQIENKVWGTYDEVMTSNALRTIIKNLRKKLSNDLIQNISGIGYKLVTS